MLSVATSPNVGQLRLAQAKHNTVTSYWAVSVTVSYHYECA